MRRIEITEHLCTPETHPLEEFILAQTLDALENPLTPAEGQMLGEEIDRLRNLVVGESMDLGELEAGLAVKRVE